MVRPEERERRAYKDAHAAAFAKTRHFPALSQLQASVENVILLQDCTPVTAVVTPRASPAHSRLHAPDAFDQIFENQVPMLTAFRQAVLCKHSNARDERHESPPPTTSGFIKPPKAPFVTKSAADAKAAIRHPCEYDYPTGLHTHRERVPNRHDLSLQEDMRRRAGHVWRPSNATTAKKSIEVDYYVNSALPTDPLIDRKTIKAIVARNPVVQRRPKL
ncbi:hypothetical protein SDRG_15772 [Saprolegnia diclina VS20]|uniref:Uncharacterized protein n=1 Tax=Saprolegnia diclina (strain VS20) TaxID=1156394 RepID=T0RA85_SAPDV|nr:hypothetical protein SDRG_15772 [Saprolegnia diclina VS20]EQC26427.1 hypothetical protein SDRG_15772 [Saprolegnia diclina VS20]|eukprot:XP_008620176.1 hypothetical protein SDRG_15772 [Saprolegnia diclina VS20]